MQSDISLLTVQNDHHAEELYRLNYSFSDCSEAFNSTKKSGNTDRQKPRKFGRKKSRTSAEAFRSKIKSIGKVNQSNCSTNRDEINQSKVVEVEEKKQKMKPNNFKNIYNLEHRNKNAPSKRFFDKQNHPKKFKFNRSQKSKENGKNFGSEIKYCPMADVLNYREKPLKNQTMIQRRLFNKIQMEATYY